jgi:hypothetical protein
MKREPSPGEREARQEVEAAILRVILGLLLMVCGALLACTPNGGL